ncbi:MAG: hypothetical protein JNJ61_19990 [Anaerolineae bacterium]|nr:hypothetical protein [Anaerolineae bacterium]
MGAIENLHNRINLTTIPFTERGSRVLVFRKGDTLALRMAERWEKWQDRVGHYRQRPPVIDQLTLLGADGAPLTFTPDTYPHVISLLTEAGQFDWTFLDAESLLIRLPPGRSGLSFRAYAQSGQTDRRGCTLQGRRNIACTTQARLLRNTIQIVDEEVLQVEMQLEAAPGDVLLLNITPRRAYNRSLPDAAATIEAARKSWQAWFESAPPVLDVYQKQYEYAWWVMRVGLLNTRYFFTREACVPSKVHYVGVWHWDQFFHALAYRHVDSRLAEDQLRIVFDHQLPNGMLPDAIHDEGLVTHLTYPVDADVTKPPLAAWTALKLYELSGRRDFLDELYEPLLRWHNWWLTFNANHNDLCEYRHPFSSGLDDSPLWDAGMPVVAPDLNTYLCLQCESLGRIAEILGYADDAARFRADADDMAQAMLANLWDERRGYFVALHNHEPLHVFTLFNLLPLWTGRLPQDVVERLIQHLTGADFWSQYPLPTVALSDPAFDPVQMWRGPTWVNINYLFIEALQRVGRHDLAQTLRGKTLELLMRHDDIYEYYHPLTAERPPKAAPIFGWSSAVFIDLAIQETISRQRNET